MNWSTNPGSHSFATREVLGAYEKTVTSTFRLSLFRLSLTPQSADELAPSQCRSNTDLAVSIRSILAEGIAAF